MYYNGEENISIYSIGIMELAAVIIDENFKKKEARKSIKFFMMTRSRPQALILIKYCRLYTASALVIVPKINGPSLRNARIFLDISRCATKEVSYEHKDVKNR